MVRSLTAPPNGSATLIRPPLGRKTLQNNAKTGLESSLVHETGSTLVWVKRNWFHLVWGKAKLAPLWFGYSETGSTLVWGKAKLVPLWFEYKKMVPLGLA